MLGSESGLISVSDVEEAIGVLSLLVDFTHEGVALEQVSAVYEEVKGAGLWEFDSLSDDVVEMIGGKIIWNKVPVVQIWQKLVIGYNEIGAQRSHSLLFFIQWTFTVEIYL